MRKRKMKQQQAQGPRPIQVDCQEMVDARAVRFAYTTEEGDASFALNGVDIQIEKGSFSVILGHNGSGKSTFAKLINALQLPQSGTMVVAGMDTSDEEKVFDIRRTAGMVFQNPDNQLVATVVEEEVAFGPENLGVPQPEILERVDRALEAVGLEEYRRRAPHMLSGGQKQRVAIAGALAMEPQLLVFDEATAMLDPKGRQEILEIIHYLNREKGMTILLITHFMEEAVEADRVFVLSGGLVLAQGTPKEIFPQAELLKEARLLPPFAAAMAQTLREAGIEIPQEIITMEALADAISQKWPAGVIPRIEEIERPAEGTLEGEVPILEAKALSYTYMPGTPFEHKALDDVSLSIREGEFIGIVGHTGSGKSTLIQLLSGLIPKTQGEILVAGKDIWAKDYDKKELRRTVGVVFQYPEYQLFEETVEKDIQFGPKKTGIPEEELESRTRVAMELVGLDYDAYREKSPFELSGGQKRKAAIAGVLAMEPKVLIMDEPIAGLDPMGRTSLMDLVRDLRDCGVTVIMISHNMEGLAEYASRILVMQKGRLVLDGPPEEIFSNYQAFREAGLDIPEAAQMAELLQERNIPIPSSCIRYGQLANCLIEGMRGESHD